MTGDTNGYHDHLIARGANGQRVDPEPLIFGEDDVQVTPEQVAAINHVGHRMWAIGGELMMKGSMTAAREKTVGEELQAEWIKLKTTLQEMGVEGL
ncbi:MAG: hypothetical protein JW384_02785 [Nitrosomonadaceae bacterium]|nr:hypothetical protein [Nitrosomonadaceae bacterium]